MFTQRLSIEKYFIEIENVCRIASAKLISRITSTTDIHQYLKLLFERQIQSLTQVSHKEFPFSSQESFVSIRFFPIKQNRILVQLSNDWIV